MSRKKKRSDREDKPGDGSDDKKSRKCVCCIMRPGVARHPLTAFHLERAMKPASQLHSATVVLFASDARSVCAGNMVGSPNLARLHRKSLKNRIPAAKASIRCQAR